MKCGTTATCLAEQHNPFEVAVYLHGMSITLNEHIDVFSGEDMNRTSKTEAFSL